MKIKLDENFPFDLAESLAGLNDVDTVLSEGLQGQDDDSIWSAAQSEGRFFW